MGIVDLGDIIGEMSFNHSGAVGLGFWTDNMPNWLVPKDPALDVLKYMSTGVIFFPIPGAPAIIMKPFQLWPLPPFFPTGLNWKISFFFGDKGGCFFMAGPSPSMGPVDYMSVSGPKYIMVMPLAIKFVAPSWLFILSDVKVFLLLTK